jgi:hypothetical protein
MMDLDCCRPPFVTAQRLLVEVAAQLQRFVMGGMNARSLESGSGANGISSLLAVYCSRTLCTVLKKSSSQSIGPAESTVLRDLAQLFCCGWRMELGNFMEDGYMSASKRVGCVQCVGAF